MFSDEDQAFWSNRRQKLVNLYTANIPGCAPYTLSWDLTEEVNYELANQGEVIVLKDGIITIKGLRGLKAGEAVWVRIDKAQWSLEEGFVTPTAMRALVLNLNKTTAQAMLLGNEQFVQEGAVVLRSKEVLQLACGLGLFGQVLDALGENKLEQTSYQPESKSRVEQKAAGIIDRSPVRIPLRTGIKAVDSLVPIGRGQRELIIGDRQTGKTSIAIDTILNHVLLNNRYRFNTPSTLLDLRSIVWFIYNAIGQKQSTVNQVRQTLLKNNALWFTSIVASTAAEPAPLQFLAPYTACTLGEFIRDVVGGHAVVIYDDLSKHAVAYRQMSLLLRRPPGREAFPGDVFYVHSRLLERAGSLTVTEKRVRGTLTAFPIIETQAGDVSAYIPTNVISITDGQIFLETELFYRGIRPAVNVGLSVSRVGSAAQPGIMKKVAGSLKMELAQYREIEGFSKLGASLDESTQRILNRGECLIEILKQNLHTPLSTVEQVLSIFLGVGYSGSWLQTDVLGLRTYRNRSAVLYSRWRVRMSWLEAFRTVAPDFSAAQVIPFLNGFLSFVRQIGVLQLNLSISAENSLLSLLKRYPLAFFDDLVTAFLYETSLLNWSAFALPQTNINVSLYNLRLVSGEISVPSLVAELSSVKSLRSIPLRILLRQLALVNTSSDSNENLILRRFIRVFLKTTIRRATSVIKS